MDSTSFINWVTFCRCTSFTSLLRPSSIELAAGSATPVTASGFHQQVKQDRVPEFIMFCHNIRHVGPHNQCMKRPVAMPRMEINLSHSVKKKSTKNERRDTDDDAHLNVRRHFRIAPQPLRGTQIKRVPEPKQTEVRGTDLECQRLQE